MSSNPKPITLSLHLALLSRISFGGIPSVLPDIFDFVVVTNRWMTVREFADLFAVAQAIPGPNMILMMGFIGWKVGGFPGAIACALSIFGLPCVMYYAVYRLWDQFRHAPGQEAVRRGIVPLTVGLVIAGGTVMARAFGRSCQGRCPCCSPTRG